MSPSDGPGRRATVQRWLREFVIIVLGVLVALWVGGLSQARQDRQRERVDLRQLLETTMENEARIVDALDEDRAAFEASRRLLAAVADTAPLPDPDSLTAWREAAFRFSLFFPMTGLYDAMAQTGSLNLVRNDSLRAQIAGYSGALAGTTRELDRWTTTFEDNVATLLRTLPLEAVQAAAFERPRGSDVWRHDSLQRALFLQSIISRNRVNNLETLLRSTRALRAALEAEIGPAHPADP